MKIKDWGLVEWAVQVVWLVMLTTIIGGGAYWIADFYEHTTIDPNSPLGVLATLLIFVPVIAVFFFHWLLRKVLLLIGFKETEE